MQLGSTWYSTTHHTHCRVVETREIWGNVVCTVWLIEYNTVVQVPADTLRQIEPVIDLVSTGEYISYIASASKIRETLDLSNTNESKLLISALESRAVPLPHQIYALNRALSTDRIRYLFADEVGLGKTIEAGFVIRELKLRGLAKRILIVAPKGLATQWVGEMATHFNESFKLVMGEDINALQRFAFTAHQDDTATSHQRPNPWLMFDQVIVTLDAVKPIERRKGWSDEQLAEYNRMRYDDLITAQWDLIIIDEAHRLGGSTDQVARYRLGRGLADAASYVLLLSATPHQGKSDAFFRIMNLLDSGSFPDMRSVTRDRVSDYIIRTEKRRAINHAGEALFKPRRTHLMAVKWEARHHRQQLLYEAVADYVREGYNQALREQRPAVGFLMLLMQRLVVSSTAAICQTLERRLNILQATDTKISDRMTALDEQLALHDEIAELDSEAQLAELLQWHSHAVQNEILTVTTLLNAARQCLSEGNDAKADALIELIYQLQAQRNNPDLKILIFTEFVPTQHMLAAFLRDRGISVVTLNGSMDMDERRHVQNQFRNHARILISTDAGGEGLNLQFCHIVMNYDLPWNPMRVEQRIGRVDRIGQQHTVQAFNFILADTVEYHVFSVLEDKLARILQEFGVDKASDVLDSNMNGQQFDELFKDAVMNPQRMLTAVDHAIDVLRQNIEQTQTASPLSGISHTPEIQQYEYIRTHPLPHWLMRMTTSYINYRGGAVTQRKNLWDLTWPDGTQQRHVTFRQADAILNPDSTLLTLESPQIRHIIDTIPQWNRDQLIPRIRIPALAATIQGSWALCEIGLQSNVPTQRATRIPHQRRRMVALFRSNDGRIFGPTARHIWDHLLGHAPQVDGVLNQEDSQTTLHHIEQAIESIGADVFAELQRAHLVAISKEHDRLNNVFRARREAIAKVGLPEVRNYRYTRCDLDEAALRTELHNAQQVMPTIRILLCIAIDA